MWRVIEAIGLWEVDHGIARWTEDGTSTDLTPRGFALYLAVVFVGFCLACAFEGSAYL